MTNEEFLRHSFVALQVNVEFTQATLRMRDDSRLRFHHRVGERWAEATGAAGLQDETTLAAQVLALVTMFRLNAKHLEVGFQDGGHWEARFKERRKEP
jgi:hypothetical protein